MRSVMVNSTVPSLYPQGSPWQGSQLRKKEKCSVPILFSITEERTIGAGFQSTKETEWRIEGS